MTFTPPTDRRDITALLQIMSHLRNPEGGCPWDLDQDYKSIAPYTIEEAYEVVDAIERGAITDIKDELGDLLLQVVFHAQIGTEAGDFDFASIVEGICDKMVRRHPHVFEQADGRCAAGQTRQWEDIKAAERADKGKAESLLDDVPLGLPAMTRATKLQKRAARVGFDWTDPGDVLLKMHEEIGELIDARRSKSTDAIEDEFGDVLFTIANLARHLKVDPEKALRRTNEKFRTRFQYIENMVTQSDRDFGSYTLNELESLWQEAKSSS